MDCCFAIDVDFVHTEFNHNPAAGGAGWLGYYPLIAVADVENQRKRLLFMDSSLNLLALGLQIVKQAYEKGIYFRHERHDDR